MRWGLILWLGGRAKKKNKRDRRGPKFFFFSRLALSTRPRHSTPTLPLAMLRSSSPDIVVENLFGPCSSRHGSGFITKAPRFDAGVCGTIDYHANSDLESTPIINTHLGPHLIRWKESIPTAPALTASGSSSNSQLERVSLQRLHSDAVTQLLPLESTYSTSSIASGSSLVVSSSYRGEVALWTGDFTHLTSWDVYGPAFSSMDLPINWMSWNPVTQQLAVASGPKNPSMPDPPENDKVSPTLPKTHRISIYNLQPVVSAVESHSPNVPSPNVMQTVDFVSNGEVFLAHSRLLNGTQLLAAALVDSRRDHSVLLFHKDHLSIERAARLKLPGGAVTHFTSSPDGSLLFLVKASTLFTIKPNFDETTDSPTLELVSATKLSDSECSPIHFLKPQTSSTASSPSSQPSPYLEFLTYDSRGTLLHFGIVDPSGINVHCLKTVPHQVASSSGSAPHILIWDDSQAPFLGSGRLFRIGGSSLEMDRLSASLDASSGIFSPVAFNAPHVSHNLYKLTCCGTGFDATGEWLAIGDWSGTVAIWRVQGDHASQHAPSTIINLKHSMIRSLDWTRHPTKNRSSLMVGDISGNLFECSLSWNESTGAIETTTKKISNTKKTLTCMQWIPKDNLMLAEQGLDADYTSILATGDSDGKLRLYGRSATSGSLAEIAKIQAHEQMPHVTSRDIWTVSFSPCGRYIATGSEDYTVHIYRISRSEKGEIVFEHLQTLEGPDAAVTCVDWQNTPLGTLLLVVSDDRTLHVWRQEGSDPALSLHSVLRTNWEHLMITYACLETNGTRIVCATMSGYIYVFDLAKENWRKRSKLHLGSIEGLSWNRAVLDRAQLAACSSDCTASLFSLEKDGLNEQPI